MADLVAHAGRSGGCSSAVGVALVRKQRHYVAAIVDFDGKSVLCWIADPLESLVSGRGRRTGNFVPPEDARLIRESLKDDMVRFQLTTANPNVLVADILECLREVCWEQAGGGEFCVQIN